MTRARDVADNQENLGGAVPPFAAGKNKIINGDFGIWQRGTSFDITASTYNADRFLTTNTGNTGTVSQQTFTLGSAPVAGYEAQYFARTAVTGVAGASNFTTYAQRIEDVRTFAGQTVTISYWAKADAAKSVSLELQQFFGTGGSANVNTFVVKQALTTSWVRYTSTVSVPSIAGKTIGTGGTQLDFRFFLSAGSTFDARTGTLGTQSITFDLWGVQIEAGNVATPFTTATGTIQGELAACQRYCYVIQGNTTNASSLGTGYWNGTTNVVGFITPKAKMRTTPTLIYSAVGDFEALQVGVSWNAVSAVALAAEANADTAQFSVTTTGGTSGQAANIRLKALSTAYVGLVAEL